MDQICQIIIALLLSTHLSSAPLAQYRNDYDQRRLEALRQLRDLVQFGLEETQRESADVDRREVGGAAAPATLDDIVAGARVLSRGLEAEYLSSQRSRTTTITTVTASSATWTTGRDGLNETVAAAGVFTALWFQNIFHRAMKALPLAAKISILVFAVLIIVAIFLLCIVCCCYRAKNRPQCKRLGDDHPQTLKYDDLDMIGKKQPPYGIINFSLEYVVQTCQLIVTVYSCTSLPKDLKNLDPYIVINISPDIPPGASQPKPPVQSSSGIAMEHSKVVKGCVNPAFNYTRVFKIKDRRQLKRKIITLEVYDWDFGTRHRMVACKRLNFVKFGERLDNILGRMVEYSENLKPGKNPEATGPGDVCLSLCYSSLENHLWVHVIESKGVFIQKMEMPDSETMPNTYVKLNVSLAGSTKRMKQRTNTIKESRNPYFNKQFVFKLNPEQLQDASVRVTLVHRTETLRIKRIMGVLTLSLQAEKNSLALLHWREVLLNFDRPSSRWHTLITPEVERKTAERMAEAERKRQLELAEEKDSSATAVDTVDARGK